MTVFNLKKHTAMVFNFKKKIHSNGFKANTQQWFLIKKYTAFVLIKKVHSNGF